MTSVTDITNAFDARASVIGDGGLIDLADFFYEQGRSDPKDRPFVGAADLTSYFIYEKVSALRARLMKAVFGVRPFCFVEGWGEDAKKAPYVEEFHDWQVRKGDLPLELYKTVHGALLEDGYILEVSERIETRRIVEELDVALELHPDTQGPFWKTASRRFRRTGRRARAGARESALREDQARLHQDEAARPAVRRDLHEGLRVPAGAREEPEAGLRLRLPHVTRVPN
jgi:hypothetical protein